MSFLSHAALQCPLDSKPLTREGNCLRCAGGHSFDIARQGYVNLLGAQDKRSRDPGDNKAMIKARADFLNAGYYQPLATRLGQLAKDYLGGEDEAATSVLADAGCGEGYYLQQVTSYLKNSGVSPPHILGFDISKWAMQAAARRLPATWLVASNRRIPLAGQSVDLLLSLFGFPDYSEFRRILKPDGVLILVNAGPAHLLELREIIYPSVRIAGSPQHENAQEAGFSLLSRTELGYPLSLPDQDAINQLLSMTPHLFRASAEGKRRADSLNMLSLGVDVVFDVMEKAA